MSERGDMDELVAVEQPENSEYVDEYEDGDGL